MIKIMLQASNCYKALDAEGEIGSVRVSYNPYHLQNAYLDLQLNRYSPADAGELFRLLRNELGCPLQVMVSSREEKKYAFLTAGGFQRKRRCYEIEVTAGELKAPVKAAAPMVEIGRNHPDYTACCGLLYNYYRETHKAVSPLTADRKLFCSKLPSSVLLQKERGNIQNLAFVEENEIAYVAAASQPGFYDFAQTLLAHMLERYGSTSFECDDCDPAAMELRSFCNSSETASFDTYIYDEPV